MNITQEQRAALDSYKRHHGITQGLDNPTADNLAGIVAWHRKRTGCASANPAKAYGYGDGAHPLVGRKFTAAEIEQAIRAARGARGGQGSRGTHEAESRPARLPGGELRGEGGDPRRGAPAAGGRRPAGPGGRADPLGVLVRARGTGRRSRYPDRRAAAGVELCDVAGGGRADVLQRRALAGLHAGGAAMGYREVSL